MNLGPIMSMVLASSAPFRFREGPPPPFPDHQWYVPGARYQHWKGEQRTYHDKTGGVTGRVTYSMGGVEYSCTIRRWEQWVVGCTRLFTDSATP